jgi:hypothetical protein
MRRFSFEQFREWTLDARRRDSPALVTFGIRHKRFARCGTHCAVAVDADCEGIHLIDSLGRRDGRRPNATILPTRIRGGWVVRGAPLIVTNGPLLQLVGLPPMPVRWETK